MYIDSDMCSCPSKMYIIVGLLKLICGKYFDGINCELFTTGEFSLKWADTVLGSRSPLRQTPVHCSELCEHFETAEKSQKSSEVPSVVVSDGFWDFSLTR